MYITLVMTCHGSPTDFTSIAYLSSTVLGLHAVKYLGNYACNWALGTGGVHTSEDGLGTEANDCNLRLMDRYRVVPLRRIIAHNEFSTLLATVG